MTFVIVLERPRPRRVEACVACAHVCATTWGFTTKHPTSTYRCTYVCTLCRTAYTYVRLHDYAYGCCVPPCITSAVKFYANAHSALIRALELPLIIREKGVYLRARIEARKRDGRKPMWIRSAGSSKRSRILHRCTTYNCIIVQCITVTSMYNDYVQIRSRFDRLVINQNTSVK